MTDFEIMCESKAEHDAWLEWCKEFGVVTSLDINMEQFTLLCKMVQKWGETYHTLKVAQEKYNAQQE